MRTFLICMLCAVTAYAQYNDSPAPPRLQIPGAIPVRGPPAHGFRQGRLQPAPIGSGHPLPVVHRVRRPGNGRPSFKSVDATPPRPNLQPLEVEPSKPVTEEPEDDVDINTPTAFSPNFFSTPEPQNDFFDITTTSQPKPPIVFNPTPTPFQPIQPTLAPFKPEPIRPTPYRPVIQPQFATIRNEPRPQPVRLTPLSSRPSRPSAFRPEPKPFIDDDEAPLPAPVRQYSRPQEPVRAPVKSTPQKYTATNPRERKPVAQIIRKYREENEDGSITWGFENDDGSFKEEIIGNDCVTRGKYGYVDPDGLKREYNYETGIICDKAKEQQEEKGFIDYQENKAILPNGVTIDLNAMGKKTRRTEDRKPYRPNNSNLLN